MNKLDNDNLLNELELRKRDLDNEIKKYSNMNSNTELKMKFL